MLNQATFRFISLALILALLSGPMTRDANAQDPPRPPEPKQTPPQAEAGDRKDERRQGAQAGEQAADKDGVFKLDTDLVLLDVTVIDQNNLSVMDLKKEEERFAPPPSMGMGTGGPMGLPSSAPGLGSPAANQSGMS